MRSFALVLFYSLIILLFGTLVYLINVKFEFPPIDFLVAITKNAILIGFGIGIGLDIYLQNESQIMKYLHIKTD